MNEALLPSLAKIAGSVILLAGVLWGVSKLAKLARLDPEVGRKLVHISLGSCCGAAVAAGAEHRALRAEHGACGALMKL